MRDSSGVKAEKGQICAKAARCIRLSEIDAPRLPLSPVVNFRPDFALKVKSWLIALMPPIFANFWMGAFSRPTKDGSTLPHNAMDEPRYHWKPQTGSRN